MSLFCPELPIFFAIHNIEVANVIGRHHDDGNPSRCLTDDDHAGRSDASSA
jgi:hypothetical protein